MANIFPIDFEEKLTMAQDDYILFSDSEDGNKIKKAQYKNLKGEKGDPGTPGQDGEDGAAATITVGSVSTGAAGSSATVVNSGTSSAAVLDFTIPQGVAGTPGTDGNDGAAATITVGTTTTLPAGSSATVENVGTSQDAILNFGIPKGDSGTGSGDVSGPASSVDGDVAVFDGTTGKLIKDGSVALSTLSAGASAGATAVQPGDNISDLTNDSGFITSSYHDSTKQDTLVSGTNIKTVNSNSLLGSGDIALNDVKVSATAPASPTEGMVWYDTTNDQLKVYDGSNWNATGKEYNAGPGIEIGTIQDYSAMQGPAPSGFHVPLNTEWQAVYNIWTALGGGSSDGTNFGIALKLPFAGSRNYTTSNVSSQGSSGNYWSSPSYNSSTVYSFCIFFRSSTLYPQSSGYRTSGYSVRCFKDVSIIPTSSWTKLYGTSIESGGIFWSSTDGLISLSSDGQNWITIADKNLGATTVWNSGDTLSEANCGYYYQRGNNYGFPRTGTIANQGTTQVNASNYGPGNYYSSNTFIKYNSGRWDTTDNRNLRGGETGVVTIDDAITNTGVLSVNGKIGDVTLDTFQLAPNSPLNPKYRRYGTQAQYEALAQYYTDEPGDTVYFTI